MSVQLHEGCGGIVIPGACSLCGELVRATASSRERVTAEEVKELRLALLQYQEPKRTRLLLALAALERRAQSSGRHSLSEPTKVMQRPNGCWAACISTLTGIPLDEFPTLPDDARDEAWWDEHGTDLRNQMTAVLRSHGWRKESTWSDIPRGFAMAYGKSPRGHEHAVVVLDGELWHDPHPEGGGLLDVTQYEILVPIIGKNESIARRPARPTGGAPVPFPYVVFRRHSLYVDDRQHGMSDREMGQSAGAHPAQPPRPAERRHLVSEQRPSAASGMRAGFPADAATDPAGRSSKAEDRR